MPAGTPVLSRERFVLKGNSRNQEQERGLTSKEDAPPVQTPAPALALKRLEKLVGTWMLTGRTLNLTEDTITGWTTFEWLPGGLKSVGEIAVNGFLIQS